MMKWSADRARGAALVLAVVCLLVLSAHAEVVKPASMGADIEAEPDYPGKQCQLDYLATLHKATDTTLSYDDVLKLQEIAKVYRELGDLGEVCDKV